jgi:hypothetical protein
VKLQAKPTEQTSPFEVGRFYSYRDLKRMGLVGCWNTLKNWQQKRGMPPGRMYGGRRLWTGAELISWTQSN